MVIAIWLLVKGFRPETGRTDSQIASVDTRATVSAGRSSRAHDPSPGGRARSRLGPWTVTHVLKSMNHPGPDARQDPREMPDRMLTSPAFCDPWGRRDSSPTP